VANAYPQFRSSYSHEEMVEHFLLTPAELQLVFTCRGDANRCGMALLLKTISHPGYVPDQCRKYRRRSATRCRSTPPAVGLLPGTAARTIIIWRKFPYDFVHIDRLWLFTELVASV